MSKLSSAFAVHGHFYQPARDDPLTGEIPWEDGSLPFANWNERIYSECYLPNAMLGNFGRISFNLGPTLTDWLARYHPETLTAIVSQEQDNYEKHGVGNGMAQAYHHTILPLDLPQDKVTQVRWGIADFEFRFGHLPAGLWLPETAVDEATLICLAENGIKFTILAPWQAADAVDIRQPALVELPGGHSITVFFYDQPVSTALSFNPLATINADAFVREQILAKPFDGLLFVASDGELYGHHQQFRDKFLDYLTRRAIPQAGIQMTYPGLWLQEHPPTQMVRILDNTSWSCHHGVERWRGACGCTPQGEWKGYLREAFSWLAKELDIVFVENLGKFVSDPWELRHQYIRVLHGQMTLQGLLTELGRAPVSDSDLSQIAGLLQAQKERLRMFTSCGWFHDDFDRINPRNNVIYAAQAVYAFHKATGIDLAPEMISQLARVVSWRSGLQADIVFTQHLERARNQINP